MAITKPVIGQPDWGHAVNQALDALDAQDTGLDTRIDGIEAGVAASPDGGVTRGRFYRTFLFGGGGGG